MSNTRTAMTAEAMFSVAMLGGFIWAVRVMLPKALKEQDTLALAAALLTAVLTLLAWLFVGVRVTSGP